MSLKLEESQLLEDLKDKMIQNPSYYPLLKTCSTSKYGDILSGKTRRSKPAIWSTLIVPPAAAAGTSDATVRPAELAAGTGISLAAPVATPSLFSRLRGSRGVAIPPEPLGATPGPAPSLFSRLRGSRGVAVAPAPAGGSKRKTKKNKSKSKKH